jgi:glycosyltransferase involved in cell wall biosynthesis
VVWRWSIKNGRYSAATFLSEGNIKMRILVDLSLPTKGTKRTRQGLAPALERLRAEARMEIDYVVPFSVKGLPPIKGRWIRVPGGRGEAEVFNEQFLLPWLAPRYDLVFTYREGLRVPETRRWKLVVQIHEHPHARYSGAPSLKGCLWEALQRWRAGQVYRRADALLFSSAWARSDFSRLERFSPPVGLVVDLSGWPDFIADSAHPVTAKPYVLAQISADRRDSLEWGLEVWREADLPHPWRLLVIGRRRQQEQVPDNVEFVGWLPDDDLRNRMASASAYLHVGQMEGFGITIVEALQLGVPVVAPATSAIPQVLSHGGGTAAETTTSAAQAIRAVASGPSLRAEALSAGAHYRWRKTARQLCEVFRSVHLAT